MEMVRILKPWQVRFFRKMELALSVLENSIGQPGHEIAEPVFSSSGEGKFQADDRIGCFPQLPHLDSTWLSIPYAKCKLTKPQR